MFRLGSSQYKTICLGGTSAKGISSSSLLCRHSASPAMPLTDLEELEAQMQEPYIKEGPNCAWPPNVFCKRKAYSAAVVSPMEVM